jgi:NADPH:quinone reductase-like Zn-dependent oxidoreductase
LQENETLLIHAVGSGVGLAALQLAKAKILNFERRARQKIKMRRVRI